MSDGAPPVPGMQPFHELARAGDWRALVAHGRFALAARALRLATGGDGGAGAATAAGADELVDVDEALEALAEVEVAIRAKAPARARAALARIEPKPQGLVDWPGLDAELAVLETASEALDRREGEVARPLLDEVRQPALAAERETLLGTAAVLAGDDAAAAAHFELALRLDPQHVRAWTNLGNVRLEAGDVDGAIADYEQALRIDDGFANAYHNLGVAFRRKGQIGKSVAALRKAQRHAMRRDAETARAGLRRGRGDPATPAGRPAWRRWLWIAAGAALVIWFLQQRGTI